MRLAKLSLVFFVFGLLAAGCPRDGGPRDAGRDTPIALTDVPRPDSPFVMPDTPVAPPDVPAVPRDVPGGGRDAGRACFTFTCTADADCMAMCPANPMGANCCDTAVGRCYASTMPACPAMRPDGGMSMYGTP